ncbi:MAG: N-acetylmuramoyl-L-alanine amidase [Candidatus Limnocylindria bacterium]
MRRRALRGRRIRLAGLVALLLFGLFPAGSVPAVASPRVTGVVVAKEVAQDLPARRVGSLTTTGGVVLSGADAGVTGDQTLLFTSPVIAAGQLFDRVGAHWIAAPGTESSFFIELRTSADARGWGEWETLQHDEDLADLERNEWYAMPRQPVANARYAQYRVWLTGGDPDALRRVAINFLDVNDLNLDPVARLLNDVKGALRDVGRSYAEAAPSGQSRILSRQDWAADESIMRWIPEYQKPHTKAVIHHTVTGDGGSNVAAELRSIYHFHANTRGWGDIGYQYLVDKFGNIWSGRQGGDHVIGGHAFGWNDGAFAVAAIGTYTTTPPTSALQGAIANIIAMKFAQYGLQPFGNETFVHKEQRSDGTWIDVSGTPPNIQGHSDCTYKVGVSGGQTACPGSTIYNMLDGLRRLAQTAVTNGYAQLVRYDPALPKVGFPGQSLSVPVMVTNRGATTIPAGTMVGYRVLSKGTPIAQSVGAALASAVPPGASAAASVPFAVPALGSYVVRWDLNSGGNWWSALYATPYRDMWFRSADWSADWRSDTVARTWTAGESRVVSVTVRNDGGRPWPAGGSNPVRLGYYWTSDATGNEFPSSTRAPLPADVPVGQTVTLTIPVTAPPYPTNYTLALDLVKEGEFWFKDKGVPPATTSVAAGIDPRATYTVTPVAFTASQTATVPVTVRNDGTSIFPITSAYPVNLGYHWYDGAGKVVVWDGARTRLPADLAPGTSVQLQAQVTAPPSGGSYSLRFDLVQEGIAWFSSRGTATGNVSASVAGPPIKSYGATYQPGAVAGQSGARLTVPVAVTNTGTFPWPVLGPNPVRLSYHWANGAGQTVVWEGLRTPLAAILEPGGSVTLQAAVQMPSAQGTYRLRWDLVEEGVTWFVGKGVPTADQTVTVGPPPFYGGSLDVSQTPAAMPRGQTVSVPLRVQNLSNFDWAADVNLSYHWYDAAGRAVVWDGLRTSLAGIRVNEVRALSAQVLAPATDGTYTLRFDIVREGATWFSSQGMQLAARTVAVAQPAHAAAYSAPASAVGPAGSTITIPVTLTNNGSQTWQVGAVNLSYHLYSGAGAVVVWDGTRTALPSAIADGQSTTVQAIVTLPAAPGVYTLKLDLVKEGEFWFSSQGVAPASVTLSVQ